MVRAGVVPRESATEQLIVATNMAAIGRARNVVMESLRMGSGVVLIGLNRDVRPWRAGWQEARYGAGLLRHERQCRHVIAIPQHSRLDRPVRGVHGLARPGLPDSARAAHEGDRARSRTAPAHRPGFSPGSSGLRP